MVQCRLNAFYHVQMRSGNAFSRVCPAPLHPRTLGRYTNVVLLLYIYLYVLFGL